MKNIFLFYLWHFHIHYEWGRKGPVLPRSMNNKISLWKKLVLDHMWFWNLQLAEKSTALFTLNGNVQLIFCQISLVLGKFCSQSDISPCKPDTQLHFLEVCCMVDSYSPLNLFSYFHRTDKLYLYLSCLCSFSTTFNTGIWFRKGWKMMVYM